MGTMTRTAPESIRSERDTEIYRLAFAAAMEIFHASRSFPKEETYSLTDQIRRSARSVVTNFVEARRKRRYKAAFISKPSDAESEAAETQSWFEFAVKRGYLNRMTAAELFRTYNRVIAILVGTINKADNWLLSSS